MFVEFLGREFRKITKRISAKLKGSTNFSNGFFVALIWCVSSESSVCSFHGLRFIVFGFLRGYESIFPLRRV